MSKYTHTRNEALQTIAKLELLHSALTGEAELAPKAGLEWAVVKQASASVKACSLQLQIELMKTQSRYLTAHSSLRSMLGTTSFTDAQPKPTKGEDSVQRLLDLRKKLIPKSVRSTSLGKQIDQKFTELDSSWRNLATAISNGSSVFNSQVLFLKRVFGAIVPPQITRSSPTYAAAAPASGRTNPDSNGWDALLGVSEPDSLSSSPPETSSSYSGPYLG